MMMMTNQLASWEIMEGEDNEMENLQKALEDLWMQNGPEMSVDTNEQTAESIQTNGALSIPLAALGFMTRNVVLGVGPL
ncbi:unnamed protein product [Lactuca virosa]|uniref:Uncharacterized protein n=1 Tax=Lactuca virosa TaxID=75947 RepID=A0AAU9M426_9ASTR|nr:unnamed protein product [Lactuca virosa]